jgi:heat shock protein HslJ
MKRILVLIPIVALLSNCGTPRSTHPGSGSPTSRAMKNKPASPDGSTQDEVVVTGTQYIPVYGKNEAGVRHELEGAWVLQSMPATLGEGKTNPNNITTGKSLSTVNEGKDFNGTILSDRMKNSKEVKRDSTYTTSDGVTHTTTIVYLIDQNGNQQRKITPPQSSNPTIHVPEKPGINFFGNNETFAGFTGCNKISGRYTLSGANKISFQNAAPSTKMACIGEYDEDAFLTTLRRVNTFRLNNGNLELMEAENVLLVFSKK